MRNFIVLLAFVFGCFWIADSVIAGNLYDLYTDHSSQQTQSSSNKTKTSTKSTTNYSSQYNSNYSSNTSTSSNELVKKGSKNYGQYASVNKLTNPVRINNPYNNLNNKYMTTDSQIYSSAIKYDGEAVKFKQGADGSLYGYNKYGVKVGKYKVNSNGTTTKYDSQGNKQATYK